MVAIRPGQVVSQPEPAGTRVLVVEDDVPTRAMVKKALLDEGYLVEVHGTGAAATSALSAARVSALVLDVSLPDGSGVDLCREWRRRGIRVPILMLTARTDVASRIAGLDSGADDYLGKPFALAELMARLRALLRRDPAQPPDRLLRRGGVTVDFQRRQAWVRGTEVPLTRREMEVLARLAWGGGRAVSRDDLLEEIWGEATHETAASLEVIVSRIRNKLEPEGRGSLIRTVRGHGYALAGEGERD